MKLPNGFQQDRILNRVVFMRICRANCEKKEANVQ